MVDTKVKDLTEKATGAATDEFYINDVAGGDADKKLGMDGIRIAGSQVSSGTIADARLSSNVPLKDTSNTFTLLQTFTSGIRPNGRIGIGIDPQTRTALQYEITDDGNTYTGSLINVTTGGSVSQIITTTGAGLIIPNTIGSSRGAGVGHNITSTILPADDTGTAPVTNFVSQQTDGTIIDNRDLFAWKNLSTTVLSIDVNGNLDIKGNNIINTGTLTLPTSTDTLVGRATTDTLTNKTFDANATGNSLSNVDVADLATGTDGELITWDASGNPATVGAGTSGHVLTSNGAGAAPTFQVTSDPRILTIAKNGDDSKTNDSTLADDVDLVIAVEANKTYWANAYLSFDADAVGDFKVSLEFSGTAAGESGFMFSSFGNVIALGTGTNIGGGGVGVTKTVTIRGVVRTTTTGNITIQWAQNTSTGAPTTLFRESTLTVVECPEA